MAEPSTPFFELLQQLQHPVTGWAGAARRHQAATEQSLRDAAVLHDAAALLRDLIAVYEAFVSFDTLLLNFQLIDACATLEAASRAMQAAQGRLAAAHVAPESSQCLAAASLELLQRQDKLEQACLQLLRQAMPRPHPDSGCLYVAQHVVPASSSQPVSLHEVFAAATRLHLVKDWVQAYAASLWDTVIPQLLSGEHTLSTREETLEVSPEDDAPAAAAGTWHYSVLSLFTGQAGVPEGGSTEPSRELDHCASLRKVYDLGRFLRGAAGGGQEGQPQAGPRQADGWGEEDTPSDTTVSSVHTVAAMSQLLLQLWYGCGCAEGVLSLMNATREAACDESSGWAAAAQESSEAVPAQAIQPVLRLVEAVLSGTGVGPGLPLKRSCCLCHALSPGVVRVGDPPLPYPAWLSRLQSAAEAEAVWTGGSDAPDTLFQPLALPSAAPLVYAASWRHAVLASARCSCLGAGAANSYGASVEEVDCEALLDDQPLACAPGTKVRVSSAALALASVLASAPAAFASLVAADPPACSSGAFASVYTTLCHELIEAFLLLVPLALPGVPGRLVPSTPSLACLMYCDCLYLAGAVLALPLPFPGINTLPLVRRCQAAAHRVLVSHTAACRAALASVAEGSPSWTEVALEEEGDGEDGAQLGEEDGALAVADGLMARAELCLRQQLLALARWREGYCGSGAGTGSLPPPVAARLLAHYCDVIIAQRVNEVLAAGDIGEDAGRGLAGLLRRLLEGAAHTVAAAASGASPATGTAGLPHLALIARLEADAISGAHIRSWHRALGAYHLLTAPLAAILARVAGDGDGPGAGYDVGLTRAEAGRLVRAVFQPSVTRTAVLSALAAR